MSLFGSLFSGVTGLKAQGQALGIISDNIANVNTVGYKRNEADFSTLVTRSPTTREYTPGGVQSQPKPLIDGQGLLQSSASSTDLAIQGKGFFVVNEINNPTANTGKYLFTRAGSFTADKDGNLVNSAGLFLQGFAINAAGTTATNLSDLTATETVNVRGLTGSAEPTTSVSLRANLQSSQTVNAGIGGYNPAVTASSMAGGGFTPDFVRSVQIFDSKGSSRTVTLGFLKTAPANQWGVEAYVEPATDILPAAHPINGQVARGNLQFDTNGSFELTGTNTAFLGTNAAATTTTIQWAAALGLDNSVLSFNLGTDEGTDGFTQFEGSSLLISADVNGAVFGELASITVDTEGTMAANFDNGQSRNIYRIPLGTFTNPIGLQAQTGNAYLPTAFSNDVNLQFATEGGSGLIQGSTLEASTVDLANEFTDLIIVQTAFNADARIITTADEMLQELIRIKR